MTNAQILCYALATAIIASLITIIKINAESNAVPWSEQSHKLCATPRNPDLIYCDME